MKRLILGEIPSDYNPDSDVILNVASFLNHEEKIPKNAVNFFETYRHKSKKSAADEASAIAYFYLPVLTRHLNHRFSLTKGEEFWKAIIFPWLLNFSHIVLDRYSRVQSFVKAHAHEPLQVELLQKTDKISIRDTDYVAVFFQDHLVNHWLHSIFLSKNLPSSWTITKVEKAIQPVVNDEVTKVGFKRRLVESVKRRLRVCGVYGFSILNSLFFSLIFFLMPRKKEPKAMPRHPLSSQFPDFFKTPEFNSMLLEFLPVELKKVPELLERRMSFKKGKIRVLGPLFYSDLYYKVLAARAKEAGEIIFSTQHGGGYGRFRNINYAYELETQFNGFISWGWESNPDFPGKVIPLPSPFLSKKWNTHQVSGPEIILVGTRCNPYADRIDFAFEPTSMLTYRDAKRRFITHLSAKVKENFYYRAYPRLNLYFEDLAYQKHHFPDLKELKGDFHTRMKTCKLLVLDHAQTTLNLALSANVPCVCLLIDKDWEVSEYAKASMESLRAAGLIYSDPLALATFINGNFENIQVWWQSDIVQKARKEWLHQHGRVSKTWYLDWLKMFWNYS